MRGPKMNIRIGYLGDIEVVHETSAGATLSDVLKEIGYHGTTATVNTRYVHTDWDPFEGIVLQDGDSVWLPRVSGYSNTTKPQTTENTMHVTVNFQSGADPKVFDIEKGKDLKYLLNLLSVNPDHVTVAKERVERARYTSFVLIDGDVIQIPDPKQARFMEFQCWEGIVIKNGIRRPDKEVIAPYDTEATAGTQRQYRYHDYLKRFKDTNVLLKDVPWHKYPHHVVLGDGPVRLCAFKDAVELWVKDGDDIREIKILDSEKGEVRSDVVESEHGRYTFSYKRFETSFIDMELTEPDGSIWRGRVGPDPTIDIKIETVLAALKIGLSAAQESSSKQAR
jgi:hypothetical protein